MGVVPHPRGCHVVSESIPASRLRAWLERPTPASSSSAPPGMPALLRVAHGVAAALGYLHVHKVWHLHLQPASIFVEGGMLGAKVADYALGMFESCLKPAKFHRLRRCSPWNPPEVLRMSGRPVQEAAVDVYAFGVILWEMLTGRQPYADLTAAQLVVAVGYGQQRLPEPEPPPAAWTLARKCLRREAGRRPSFEQVVKMVKRLEAGDSAKEDALMAFFGIARRV